MITTILIFSKSISTIQSTGHLINWINTAVDATSRVSLAHNNLILSKIEIKSIEIEEEIKLKHLSFMIINIFLICLGLSFVAVIIEIIYSTKILTIFHKLINFY